ncbi:HAMP domain-containing histidine kinase [Clostridium sp. HV4-5-A1G]|nr:HAMP domain-containing sensor histidine kinase [Clostridium sp. HV4-5-A1G]KAA8670640.1 HAMP domain-containing histidine kinase [Clostridium sp. HV4-5-A1G]
MKIFKIKSLMMRIWITFTTTSIIIILCISLLYLFNFKTFDENIHMKDMKVVHEMLLKSNNFKEPVRFDKLRNLKMVKSFVVNINNRNEITYLNNLPNNMPPLRQEVKNGKNKAIPTYKENGNQRKTVEPRDNERPENNKDVQWMVSYTKHLKIEKEFKSYHNNKKYLIIMSPIKNSHKEKLCLVTYMPYFTDNRFLYYAIVIGFIFIVIAFFTSKFVAVYISKPLKKLENYTKEIADKNWVEPIKISSDDEIGKLARSMNIMQKKLKYADENEKIFLQSISHSLKTTVMVIMSHAQAIIDGVYIDSPERTAEIIKDESIGLEKKVKQILYLNTLEYTLENNLESEKNKSMDLRDVVSDMVDKFKVVSDDIKWELETSSSIIFANEEKIKVCLENILDNALRYAESIIKIKLKKEGDFAVVEIYDDGKHIDEDSIKLIFNHMYKDKTGNFGLGLAISKKIIDFYNGTIEAVNREKGVSFIIKHPLL